MGLVKFKDAESGKVLWLDTSSKIVRNHYYAAAKGKRKHDKRYLFA